MTDLTNEKDSGKQKADKTKLTRSRRSLLRSMAVGAGGLTTVGIAGKASAGSSDEENPEAVDYQRSVVTDNQAVKIWRVNVDEDDFMYRKHKKGRKAGTIDFKKLGDGVSDSESTSAIGGAKTKSQDSLSLAADSYVTIIEEQETWLKDLGECDYYDGKEYIHLWGATGLEFNTDISNLSKNALVGAIGLFITGSLAGAVVGTIASQILDMFTDSTVSIIANDADVPVTDSKRIDFLVSGRFEPSPGLGVGVGTYGGHMRDDAPFTFI